jgi:hypothetical protein
MGQKTYIMMEPGSNSDSNPKNHQENLIAFGPTSREATSDFGPKTALIAVNFGSKNLQRGILPEL